MYTALADLVVIVHFMFILFVIFGALLVAWRAWMLWLHLPALIWGAATELFSLICPLTPLENYLRQRGGGESYRGDFIANYLLPVIYPAGLTPEIQWLLGIALIIMNVLLYSLLWRRARRRKSDGNS